jgi:UDP-N-acetylglucosamine 2-epimerase (non-hydrolysing)
MQKVLIVIGTRPEAIKMAPVVKELRKVSDKIILKVCVAAQHREMLDPILDLFEISYDYDLNIIKPNQSLFDVTINVLQKIKEILEIEYPDFLLVQGDTTTAFAASLAAFYLHIKIGHIEAGLRSGSKYHPFPEEINRLLIDSMTDLHFAPTKTAKENLLKEGINKDRIVVTGNTVVDALLMVLDKGEEYNYLRDISIKDGSRIILVTGHRRESFGEEFENICNALKQIVEQNEDVEIVFPVHLNPNIQGPANRMSTVFI